MEKRLHTIINNLSHAIVLLNNAGEVIYASEQSEAIVGYDSKELIGKSAFDFLLINNPVKVNPAYEKIVADKNFSVNSVLRLKHKKGQAIWVELTAINLLHDKNIRGILIMVKNITDKKKLEEQKMARIISEVREKEKHALAAELHDNVNQMLTASLIFLDSAMRNTNNREKLLSKSSGILNEAISEIRKLSSSLVSYEVKDFGLVSAIKKIRDPLLTGDGIRFAIRMSKGIEELLTTDQKIQVFRIIQEQINNISKHAKATKILISLSHSCNRLQLMIKDNGVGFDVNKSRSGIGISNMIQRAKALNGHFHIISEKGGGTSVIILFCILSKQSTCKTIY